MHSRKELAACVRKAMERKNFQRDDLMRALGVNSIMAEKIVNGDIVPSRFLEKQLIEKLGIAENRVRRVTRARLESSNGIAASDEKSRRVKKIPA